MISCLLYIYSSTIMSSLSYLDLELRVRTPVPKSFFSTHSETELWESLPNS